MSGKPSKDASINKNNESSHSHTSQPEEPSNESFQTALDTNNIEQSTDSFATARTQLDPNEVKERLYSLLSQEKHSVRTIASLVSTAEEREPQLAKPSEEDEDKRIHFVDQVDSKISKRLAMSSSTASMRLPRTQPHPSNVSPDDSDHSEYLTQVNRLTRMTDSFVSTREHIGEMRQHHLSGSASIAESVNQSRAHIDHTITHSMPSPLHAGLDSKSMHSIKSTFSTFIAPLGGGHAFIYMVIPPDGGYGWLITFISFLCQVVVDGIIFGIGIVLPDMAADLGVKASSIALVASMQIGPISCAFINKYGFRPVALAGTVISIVAITIASFCPNLLMLIFFYSLIGGVSLSMIWVSSQLIIGYYFEKYRPIANGLSCSGAGAGILIFSAMNSALVAEIGWRNVLRVHLIFLVMVFFMSITFIEVRPRRVGQIFEPAFDSTTESSEGDEMQQTHRYSKTLSIFSAKIEEKGIAEMIEPYESTATYKKPGPFARCFGKCCPERAQKLSTADTEAKSYVIRTDPLEKQDLYYMGPADYDNNPDELIQDVVGGGMQVEFTGGASKSARSVNYTLSMMQSSRSVEQTPKANVNRTIFSPSYWLPKKVLNAFKVLFDVRLLRMMEFQVLLASAFFYPMGFNIPFVYSKVRANLPTQQTSLISPAIGLSNFTFRIASGFIAYKYKDYTTYICGGGIAFGGLAVLISAFYGDDVFWFQMIYAVCFGIAPAFYSTLRAIIYVRALGLDKLTNAFGLTAMAMGTGVFIGTTLAGYLNQATGSFVASFCFGGSCMILAGMLKLILPMLMKWQRARVERLELHERQQRQLSTGTYSIPE